MSPHKLKNTGQKFENPIQSIGDRHCTVTHGILSYINNVGLLLSDRFFFIKREDHISILLKDAADETTRHDFSKIVLFNIIEVIRERHPKQGEFIPFLVGASICDALTSITITIRDQSEFIELVFSDEFVNFDRGIKQFNLELPYPPAN